MIFDEIMEFCKETWEEDYDYLRHKWFGEKDDAVIPV